MMKRLMPSFANPLASGFTSRHAVSVVWRLGVTRVSVAAVLTAAVNLMACSGGVEGDSRPTERPNGETDAGADHADDDQNPEHANDAGSSDNAPNVNPASDGTTVDGGAGDDGTSDDTTSGVNPPEDDGESSDEPQQLPITGAVAARLTQLELNHVLRDVLGDTAQAARAFLAEDEYTPFDNDAQRQTVSASLIHSIGVLADDVAPRLAQDAAARAVWMPCEPESATDEVCFDATVETLGERLLRRPIAPEEVERYRTLLAYAEERQDFYVGVELLLSALLQDPEFLYRLERGTPEDPSVLTDHEVATRMGFLLLGTSPDDELLLAARNGELRDTQARRLAAQRLLDDPRARTQLNRFHAMWLGYRTTPHDATLNAAFQMETERLIEQVIFDEPQDYLQLFQSKETYINSLLAEHYGFDVPSGGEGWVAYPSEEGRAGILSHGSVLSAFSKFSDTSPTQRGIFIRTRLLCLPVASAPPTVDVDQPPGGEAADGACKFERYRAHREQSGCVDCHNLFEPIGMGLEQFDRAGRFREHDDDNEACLIEAAGEVPNLGTFSGPAELSSLLVDSGSIQACMVRHYMQYALARTQLSAADEGWIQRAAADFDGVGLLMKDWILNLVASDQFARREVTQ